MIQDNPKTIGVHPCASAASESAGGETAELLRLAHAAAEKMGIPEAGQIRDIQRQNSLPF